MPLVTDEHAGLLAGFYAEVWDPTSTSTAVLESRQQQRRANRASPGEPFPTFLFVKNGQGIGHVGSIPFLLWHRETCRGVHWIKGLMVLPQYQQGPVGFLLLKEAAAALPVSLVILGSDVASGLLRTLGFVELGPLPNRLKIIHVGNLLAKIDLAAVGGSRVPRWAVQALSLVRSAGLTQPLGLFGSVVLRARDRLLGTASRPFESVPGDSVSDEEIDALWDRAKVGIAAGAVRDARAFREAYAGSAYACVGVRRDGALVAFFAVRRPRAEGDPRLNGIRVATIADLLCDPRDADACSSSLRAAERQARGLGADALLCSTTHGALLDIMAQAGYLPVPSNLRVMTQSKDPDLVLEPDASLWWIMRGDSRADDVF